MRVILVVERKHLFPGLSPQGFLGAAAVDLEAVVHRLFFAERDYMEQNSHYKQIIPYLMLHRGQGDEARILCYQRRTKHTEQRLGGLWSVGFGGHIEPLDRADQQIAANGLIMATAVRELEEETGLNPGTGAFSLAGFINSDSEDVSSVHFGVVFRVDLNGLPGSDDEIMQLVSSQSEPHQALWIPVCKLAGMAGPKNGPDEGSFEDWSRIAIEGILV
ncbi:MAG: NUDIX domain-containing protein [Gemmatimonadales bacterium]|nr:NUDIX domain-containing protein [Gemmatimonadales bacterium]